MTRSRFIRTGVVALIVPLLIVMAYGSLYWATMGCAISSTIDIETGTVSLRPVLFCRVPRPSRSFDGIADLMVRFFGPAHHLDKQIRPELWAEQFLHAAPQTRQKTETDAASPE